MAQQEAAAGLACSRYSGTNGADDYWFLDFQFGDTIQGSYVVTGASVVGTKGLNANVALLHRVGGEYAANYPASGGTVTLVTGASVDGAVGGESIRIDVEVLFPSAAIQQLGCQGGQAKGGPLAPTSCFCQDSDGSTFTCVPEAGFDYCCTGTGDGQIPFTESVMASPCASMCRTVSGLPDYCTSVTR